MYTVHCMLPLTRNKAICWQQCVVMNDSSIKLSNIRLVIMSHTSDYKVQMCPSVNRCSYRATVSYRLRQLLQHQHRCWFTSNYKLSLDSVWPV